MLQEHQMSLNTVVVDNVKTAQIYKKVVDKIDAMIADIDYIYKDLYDFHSIHANELSSLVKEIKSLVKNMESLTVSEYTDDFMNNVSLLSNNPKISPWYDYWTYKNRNFDENLKELLKLKEDYLKINTKQKYLDMLNTIKQKYRYELGIAESSVYPFPVTREHAAQLFDMEDDVDAFVNSKTLGRYKYELELNNQKELATKILDFLKKHQKPKNPTPLDVKISASKPDVKVGWTANEKLGAVVVIFILTLFGWFAAS